jgi:hypothetical protein
VIKSTPLTTQHKQSQKRKRKKEKEKKRWPTTPILVKGVAQPRVWLSQPLAGLTTPHRIVEKKLKKIKNYGFWPMAVVWPPSWANPPIFF